MKIYFVYPLLFICAFANAQPEIRLVPFGTATFDLPVDIANAGDSRLFIVEKVGKIYILDSLGNKSAEPFLDIEDRVMSDNSEQGLLGLAFHPDYAQNGYFYVNYTYKPSGDTRISRFQRDTSNPALAEPSSEQILIEVDQPFTNHNGGGVKFGPDGYLYFSLGDGGSGGDPQNNGQKKNTLLGKIGRIDVNTSGNGLNYGIPTDNPFINDANYRPEIWSLGWRNPWRFSFDRLTGDMWIADVGQNALEEVDFEPVGVGGRNYGWRCYEGNNAFNTNGCQPASAYTSPVFQYNHSLGCSITGGFVYRGSQYPEIYGHYLVTDYCTGRWWSVRYTDSAVTSILLENFLDNQYSSLGEDAKGELYVCGLSNGIVYKITELCSGFQTSGTVTASTCDSLPNGSVALTVQGGQGQFTVEWSNGVTGNLLTNLEPGEYRVTATDAIGCQRRDTFVVVASPGLPPVVNVQNGTMLSVPGVYINYQWLKQDVQGGWVPISGATDSVFDVTLSGIYAVAVTDSADCILLSDPVGVTSADWPASLVSLQISPNPTTAFTLLELSLYAPQRFSVALLDINGRQLFFQTHQKQKLNLPIDLRGLPVGIYTLTVILPDGVVAKRVVKN